MAEGPIRVVSAEIRRGGRYLLTQRGEHAVLPLLWEFPGGRVREDESDAQALQRALMHRIGVVGRIGEMTMEVFHDYDDYSVVLAVYRVNIDDQTPEALSVGDLAWVRPEEFDEYPFPSADRQTITLLLSAEE